ncbi:MAG: HEAT repeat domain-containing protein, partial [Pirellulales bacterium]|nr:HEAT repeat domain-containing protein [Pirellulales bacterium]
MQNRISARLLGCLVMAATLQTAVLGSELQAGAKPAPSTASPQAAASVDAPEQPREPGASADETQIPTLVRKLSDADPNVRAASVRSLGELGPKAVAAVPSLVRALEDDGVPDVGDPVWILAARALGKAGPEAVPQLIEALRSPNRHVMKGAAAALSEIGPAAKEAVEPLMAALEKDDPDTRITLMYGLMGIGPEAKAAVPLLIQFLDHEDFHARYWACQALGGIGPAAAPAVPVLCRLTAEGPVSVRRHAAAA